MTERVIGSMKQLDDGDRIEVTIDSQDIVIFNLDGALHAYRNWCPHQGGPSVKVNIQGIKKPNTMMMMIGLFHWIGMKTPDASRVPGITGRLS